MKPIEDLIIIDFYDDVSDMTSIMVSTFDIIMLNTKIMRNLNTNFKDSPAKLEMLNLFRSNQIFGIFFIND